MRHIVFALVFLLCAIPCGARIITVDANGTGDYPTIQAAVDAANPGDIVELQPGIYTGDGNYAIQVLHKTLTITSIDPNDPNIVAATIIDCQQEGSAFGFYDVGHPTRLAGITITNGHATLLGGGISGGGNGFTVYKCIIENCSAGLEGGGIFNCYGVIDSCVIRGNTASLGGGISASGNKLINCTLVDNYADDGGGVAFYEGVIGHSIFSGNSASGYGGAIYALFGQAEDCIIIGNSAIKGGGIYGGWSTIMNCTIHGNVALWGGAICCTQEDYVINSILSDNIAHTGSQIAVLDRFGTPAVMRIAYSNIQGQSEQIYVLPGSTLMWQQGNIQADPCFVEPGEWVDVNDPNVVVEPNDPNAVWVDGDYHLKSQGRRWDNKFTPPRWKYDYVTSRCIDAGNPGSTLDEELLSIPGDPCNVYGGNLRINMGAYGGTAEASMPPYDWALLSDITIDGITDFIDFGHLAALYTDEDEQLPADFDRDGDVDYADVLLLTEDWLKQTTWHE